jgi:FkbM family methyltransferase
MRFFHRFTQCLLFLLLSYAYATDLSIENLPWVQNLDCINRVSQFLPTNPIVLEAGMHYGTDTLKMKAKWTGAKIYGCEPHPESFKKAYENTRLLKDVFVYPVALFDREGTEVFYMSQRNEGASSLFADNTDIVKCPPHMTPPDGLNFRDVPTTVFCTTVDRWAEKNDIHQIDYIWLDTEGSELLILQNAMSILPKVKVISIECNFREYRKGISLFSDLFEFLTEQGFTLDSICGNPEWQADAIFVRTN